MGQCDYRGVPEIIRTFVEEGPDTALWLEERVGIVWSDAIQTFTPGHRVPRGLWPAPSENYPDAGGWPQFAGNAWITMLKNALAENGGQLLLKHRLTRIFRDGDGPVVGIEVDNEGTLKTIKARRAWSWLPAASPTTRLWLVPGTRAWPTCTPMVLARTASTTCGTPVMRSGRGRSAPASRTRPSSASARPSGAPRSGCGTRATGTRPRTTAGRCWVHPVRPRVQRVILVRGNGKRYINEALGAEKREHPEKAFVSTYLNLPEAAQRVGRHRRRRPRP